MAVITEINGVSTSGTTGVNNIFGSGGGGTVNTTPTPTVSGLSATSYAGNEFLLTNSLSYTNPAFYIEVTDSTGSVVVDNDFTTEETAGFYIIRWTGSGANGTHTVSFRVHEFGDFYDSAEITMTYTKLATKFQYWRIYGADSAGTPANGNIGIREWELYEGVSQTGVNHPVGVMSGASDSLADELAGNTSLSGYEADRGREQYTYPAWRAFDGNFTGKQAWTLGGNSTSNWLELEFVVGSTEFPTVDDIPEIKSHRFRNYANDGTSYYAFYASDTGAFSGEEELIVLIDGSNSSDVTYLV